MWSFFWQGKLGKNVGPHSTLFANIRGLLTMRKHKRLLLLLLSNGMLLLIPLIAMKFTDEVNWELSDFMVAAGLLFGTSLLCELVMRTIQRKRMRLVLCFSLVLVFLIIWAELAVGIFGTPISGH